LNIIKGDILNTTHGIICHQVNCMGKMGAGLAFDIRKKWPAVYNDYMNAYRKGQLVLGATIGTEIIQDQLFVMSLCGQHYYGIGKQYTNYYAVRLCLYAVLGTAGLTQLPVFIPYGMGCNLAGGNWDIVSNIINTIIPTATIVARGV
jgi:O-acetyl-ADP-ribose deacetylase (regulator of RNase III)